MRIKIVYIKDLEMFIARIIIEDLVINNNLKIR